MKALKISSLANFIGSILILLFAVSLSAYSQAFNPLTDPGLVVRLDDQSPFYKDSAGTQVCTNGDPCGYWGDLSGHGNHAKAHHDSNKPLYRSDILSGRSGLEWMQGVNHQNLSLGNPAELSTLQGSNFTLFVVAAVRSSTHDGFILSKSYGGSNIFNIASFGGKPQSYFTAGAGTIEPNNTLFTYAVSGDPNVTEVSGVTRFYQNGSVRGSKIGGNTTNTTNELYIGDFSTGSAYYSWEGKIYAVYIFNRTLSPSEVFQMDAFIRDRYNQTWPGSASDKIVLWDGNSISMNDVIVRQVAAGLNVPNEAIFNLSWGSKDFKQMNKYAGQDVDSLIAHLPAGKKLISVGWEMTNELQTGSNAAQAYQKLQTYAMHVKQKGFKFVTGTTLPRCNNSGFDAARNSVNSLLRADITTIDGLADVALNTLMGVDGTCPNAGYYGDGVHPTIKGDSVIAPYFINTLSNVFSQFVITVTSVTLTGDSNLKVISVAGGTLQIQSAYSPANANTNTLIGWSLTDPTGKNTLGSTGLLTAAQDGNGLVTITGTYGGGIITRLVISISGQALSCTLPLQPSTITGKTLARLISNQVYNVSTLAGESYNWTVSGGGTITSGIGTCAININWISTGIQSISVTAQNLCGSSAAMILTVNVNSLISLPTVTIPGFPPTTIGGIDVLEINPDILEFSLSASAKNVTVTSNVRWIVENNASWTNVEFSTDSIIGTISVTENTSTEMRSALITLSGITISTTITVSQAGSNTPGANPTVPGTNPGTITDIDLNTISEQALTIMPNPSVVNGSVSFNKPVSAIIYDLIGNELISIKDTFDLNLQGLKQGVYIIKTERNEIRRLLVE